MVTRKQSVATILGMALLMSAGMAQAGSTPLLEGGAVGVTATSITGSVLTSESISLVSTDYAGRLVSTVITGDTTNPHSGGLTFTYQLFNDSGTGEISSLTVPGWTGFLTDVGEEGAGTSPYPAIYRGYPGVGDIYFSWYSPPGIVTAGKSQLLVVQTDATGWTDVSATVSDASILHPASYGPGAGGSGTPNLTSVPLPASVYSGLGLLGLMAAYKIRRRHKMA